MAMTTWNPDVYLRFKAERTRPAADLLKRIDMARPRRILDVGCGPGNSTALLAERWSEAEIVGMDNSAEMIEKAKREYPSSTWILGDAAGDLSRLGRFDIVFSNAALQWMPDHDSLVPRLYSLVADKGVLAVQVPNNDDSPGHTAVRQTAASPAWQDRLSFTESQTYASAEAYYRRLSRLDGEALLWETIYYHIMADHDGIVDWFRGTFMRPYLSLLPTGDDRARFEEDVKQRLLAGYPIQPDGRVLFPFKRLFFTLVRF